MTRSRSSAQPRSKARREHEHNPSTSSIQSLRAYLAGVWERDSAPDRVDLTEYLRATEAFGIPAAERLRQLAIELEPELGIMAQPSGWLALERIYQAAIQLEPENPSLHLSRALSAHAAVALSRAETEVLSRIASAGLSYARVGVSLAADDAYALIVLGRLLYVQPQARLEEALGAFDAALSLQPACHEARLFRAHCLQDLERYREAAEAYSSVDRAYFVGPRAWRLELLREQRIWCLIKDGQRDAAALEVRALLERYEREPHLAAYQPFPHLEAIANWEQDPEVQARLRRLVRSEAAY